MRRLAVSVGVLAVSLVGCLTVPDTTCFAGEACAGNDAGQRDAGGPDASMPQLWAPPCPNVDGEVPDRGALLGIPSLSESMSLWLPPTPAPFFAGLRVTPTPAVQVTSGCSEAFLGAVALPDGRALAVPHCAQAFAVVDPSVPSVTWASPELDPQQRPAFGGAVLGCDGRVYVLPSSGSSLVRATPVDGGFEYCSLALDPALTDFTGGVVASDCAVNLRIMAAARDRLVVLRVHEGSVDFFEVYPNSTPSQFMGVALSHQGFAPGFATAVASTTKGPLMVLGSTGSLGGTELFWPGAVSSFGVTVTREEKYVAVGEATQTLGAMAMQFDPSTSTPTTKTTFLPTFSDRQRWAVNTHDGWVVSSGHALMAFDEATLAGSLASTQVSGSTQAFTSGGLVQTTGGKLVDVPGANRNDFVVFTRVPMADGGVPPAPGNTALSPFFNHL